jgi:hypothetical protein
MWFIHISTMSDGEDFVSFLKGQKRKSFDDSDGFQDWLSSQNTFPLQFYLDGATYEFDNEDELLYFRLGFETAMRILK